MTTAQSLPRWDMTPIFPGLESSEFAQGFAHAVSSIDDLTAFFDAHSIQGQPSLQIDETLIQTFEALVARYNEVLGETHTLGTYIVCFVRTNSYDNLAQARMSELQQSLLRLSLLDKRFTAWLGSLDVEQLIQRSSVANEHAFYLRRTREEARHLMEPGEEALAEELNLNSGSAWARLHGNVTSQLNVEIDLDGRREELPMSVVRNMAYEPDRAARRRAFEAEIAGWKRVEVPLAAALNSIKGEVNTLVSHRKWASPLEAALFVDSIDNEIFEAMFSAARESFPDFRRYLHAKARAMGLERLAWYDLSAPVGSDGRVWGFDEAADFIVTQFGTYSQRLADFAARAFREHWIDAEPRPGKRDGAFCTDLRGGVSRVFTNYRPAFSGVSTMAHELGHGYHNLNLINRSELQRAHPMTLAETASIFCETIIRQAALNKAGKQEQIAILEASLQGSCQVVVDIISRFLFEQRVFEKRRQRELSVDELNDLMLEAQRETYGDGLDQEQLHPYMWAVKQHYYSTGRWFYNYPYMFGLLFGLGLYARYQRDPDAFKQGYDDLLASTGMADAATLSARFGIDLRSQEFWRASLDLIRSDIERFETLVSEA